jgi:hypothetical protein
MNHRKRTPAEWAYSQLLPDDEIRLRDLWHDPSLRELYWQPVLALLIVVLGLVMMAVMGGRT